MTFCAKIKKKGFFLFLKTFGIKIGFFFAIAIVLPPLQPLIRHCEGHAVFQTPRNDG